MHILSLCLEHFKCPLSVNIGSDHCNHDNKHQHHAFWPRKWALQVRDVLLESFMKDTVNILFSWKRVRIE